MIEDMMRRRAACGWKRTRSSLWAGLVFVGGWFLAQPLVRGEVLADHLTESVLTLAKREAGAVGLPGLLRDARLDRAAMHLQRQIGQACLNPPPEQVQAALWRGGVSEPGSRLLLSRYPTDQPDSYLAGLTPQLRLALRSSTGVQPRPAWSRLGFASQPIDAEWSCAILFLLETYVELAELPMRVPVGSQQPVVVRGRVLSPFRKPWIVVTLPSGETQRLPDMKAAARSDQSVLGEIRCSEPGTLQIEVLAEGGSGPTVVANQPVQCEGPARAGAMQPGEKRAVLDGLDAPWKSLPEVEARLLAALNAERVAAGRSPLIADERLQRAARAHSEEMRRDRYVGHVSPKTGSPADRAKRVGIPNSRITENLAQATTPRQLHDGLLGSPGHRANVLDREVDHVGIGCALGTPLTPDQPPLLLVTQLFAALDGDQLGTPAQEQTAMWQQVGALRREHALSGLTDDPGLRKLAEQLAQQALQADGTVQSRVADDLMKAALRDTLLGLNRVRMSVVIVGRASDLVAVTSLRAARLTHLGIAVRGVRRTDEGRRAVVLVLAEKQ